MGWGSLLLSFFELFLETRFCCLFVTSLALATTTRLAFTDSDTPTSASGVLDSLSFFCGGGGPHVAIKLTAWQWLAPHSGSLLPLPPKSQGYKQAASSRSVSCEGSSAPLGIMEFPPVFQQEYRIGSELTFRPWDSQQSHPPK